ncbi:MAG: hypothetical protein ACREFP_04645 [Acetobacteraceae bacterium]
MVRLLGMTWDHPCGYDPLVGCSEIWRAESGCEVIWDGRLCALPVDAAAQVQAWRPDLMGAPATTWEEVMALAEAGRVLVPLRPPHSLMAFYILAANAGRPYGSKPGRPTKEAAEAAVLTRLRALVGVVDPVCFSLEPIAVLERMAAADSRIGCAPLIYGHVSCAHPGFRARQIRFANLPIADAAGGTLGGAGVAVSAFTRDPAAAVAVASWLSSAKIQRGPYAAHGGQPAHRAAWRDPLLDAASGGVFSATRRTLERAYLRPRGPHYLTFQRWAAERINEAMRGDDLPSYGLLSRERHRGCSGRRRRSMGEDRFTRRRV